MGDFNLADYLRLALKFFAFVLDDFLLFNK